ncbi:MAG TPA: OsmC family protein [Acidobacteriota bacterium]|mgnify:FL=1|nr:OsmC family protein [Acidobacteriota bacterium]HNT99711.1 OsmC family protein [Acidobacteriota bacterium]HPB27938.1 OsmC family protein [Acidobacteriota bacterium]HQP73469.1 OsmC family protein [Acidobacteriota bacterium]
MLEMRIDFPGGTLVNAHFGHHTVVTDQPPEGGGTDSAPAPFLLFLASIGTCAGIYVLYFCQQRKLSLDGIRIVQRIHFTTGTKNVETIELEIQVPASFPDKYLPALIRAADQCKVKQHLENPPEITTVTRVVA